MSGLQFVLCLDESCVCPEYFVCGSILLCTAANNQTAAFYHYNTGAILGRPLSFMFFRVLFTTVTVHESNLVLLLLIQNFKDDLYVRVL